MLRRLVLLLSLAGHLSHADQSPTPMSKSKIRWGIMGTGAIASDFTRVLKQLPEAEVAAVGSRTAERAAEFASACELDGDVTLHASYEALVADDSLDIVYVATPSLRHVDDSLACLEAGRAVLCEKSMAPSAEEAERVLEKARRRNLFFCHGVWSRFFPAMAGIRKAIESGAIGEVRSVHCSFCQADGAGSCSATLETGIYCAQFALWAFGGAAPRVAGVTYQLHPESGLDTHVCALLAFPCGGTATLECSLGHPSPREATICGTKGEPARENAALPWLLRTAPHLPQLHHLRACGSPAQPRAPPEQRGCTPRPQQLGLNRRPRGPFPRLSTGRRAPRALPLLVPDQL
jgi:dihydrodiol dehydrogenase / D-xylose 1-dehydrogenase (NADP)